MKHTPLKATHVITRQPDNTPDDQLVIPWEMAVNIFKPHLYAQLLRTGRSIKEAMVIVDQEPETVATMMDGLINELNDNDQTLKVVSQCPYKHLKSLRFTPPVTPLEPLTGTVVPDTST